MVDITIRSINTNRDLFSNPLDEPTFYAQYFRPWVQSALNEENALETFHSNALVAAGIKTPNRE